MPPSLTAQMALLPPRDSNETPAAWLLRLSDDQRAILDAFNKETADGKLWLGICRTRRT